MPKDVAKLWKIGFSTITGNNLVSLTTSLGGGILLANMPQAVLSYLYLAFNALYTNMFVAQVSRILPFDPLTDENAGVEYIHDEQEAAACNVADRTTTRYVLAQCAVPVRYPNDHHVWVVSLARIAEHLLGSHHSLGSVDARTLSPRSYLWLLSCSHHSLHSTRNSHRHRGLRNRAVQICTWHACGK